MSTTVHMYVILKHKSFEDITIINEMSLITLLFFLYMDFLQVTD